MTDLLEAVYQQRLRQTIPRCGALLREAKHQGWVTNALALTPAGLAELRRRQGRVLH